VKRTVIGDVFLIRCRHYQAAGESRSVPLRWRRRLELFMLEQINPIGWKAWTTCPFLTQWKLDKSLLWQYRALWVGAPLVKRWYDRMPTDDDGWCKGSWQKTDPYDSSGYEVLPLDMRDLALTFQAKYCSVWSQEIGCEERLQSDLFCVGCLKPFLSHSISQAEYF